MSKISKSEYVERVSDLVEKHFPKGKTKMRGEAMVLVADILVYLMEEEVIEESA